MEDREWYAFSRGYSGQSPAEPDSREIMLDSFFPADEKKIFADWYSGELAIIYKSNIETPENEQYMVFTINEGRVVSQKLKNYEEYYGYPYVKEEDDGLPF